MSTAENQKGKVIFIGDAGVGKTALLHRIIDDQFYENFGPTISSGHYNLTATDNIGETKEIQLWDTSGQERYQAITKIFFRKANTAVICFDTTEKKTITNISTWVNLLHEEAPDCKIIFVGTKADLIEDQSAILNEAMPFLQQVDYLQVIITSALSGYNVSLLKDEIVDSIKDKSIHEVALSPQSTSEDMEPKSNCC